jgi:hypothetical protein
VSPDTATQLITFVSIIAGMVFLLLALNLVLSEYKRRKAVEPTPVTDAGLAQYDDFAPGEAVILAWSEAGEHPRWHRQMQDEVRKNMPVLARALDRMVEH